MLIRKVFISVGVSVLFFAASAFGQKASIQGKADDVNGKPLKNAEVRIENEKAKNAAVITVKTDAKGSFVATGLAPGVYSVSVVLNGTVKWSAAHVKTRNGQVVYLKLSPNPTVAVANRQPKKRAVWIPDTTGSHLGGHWEDEPVRGPGANNVDMMGSRQMEQLQNIPSVPPAGGGR